MSFALPKVSGALITRAVVKRSNRVVFRKSGRNLRTLTLRRATSRAYKVQIELKTSERGQTLTLNRRVAAC